MGKRVLGAIDIGSSKITAVVATTEEGMDPKVIGVASVPAKGIKKGLVINIDEAVNSIAQALSGAERMADVTIGSVVISVSGKAITSKNNKAAIAITHEEVTPDDVLRATEVARTVPVPQGYDILHVILRECTVDAQGGIKYPIGMSGSRLEVDCHIVFAPSSITKNLAKCVQKLGISVESFVFAGWADVYSVVTDTEKELGVTLVDIGSGTTDVIVFQEGGVVYSGSIPVGGANITIDLAAGLSLSSLEDAEKVKMNFKEIMDLPVVEEKDSKTKKSTKEEKEKSKDESKNDEVDVKHLNISGLEKVSKSFVEKIIRARVEEILELARQDVGRSGYDVKMPAGIVLLGGTAKLPKVATMVKEYIGSTARVGMPHGLEGMTEEITGPEYATIQGLVLYAAGNPEEVAASGSEGEGFLGNISTRVKSIFKSLFP
ncbi:cell division protein FtsA [bacterium]|nr:cell division protein FtsA [bacterium]